MLVPGCRIADALTTTMLSCSFAGPPPTTSCVGALPILPCVRVRATDRLQVSQASMRIDVYRGRSSGLNASLRRSSPSLDAEPCDRPSVRGKPLITCVSLTSKPSCHQVTPPGNPPGNPPGKKAAGWRCRQQGCTSVPCVGTCGLVPLLLPALGAKSATRLHEAVGLRSLKLI